MDNSQSPVSFQVLTTRGSQASPSGLGGCHAKATCREEGELWACVDTMLEQRTRELRGDPRGLAKLKRDGQRGRREAPPDPSELSLIEARIPAGSESQHRPQAKGKTRNPFSPYQAKSSRRDGFGKGHSTGTGWKSTGLTRPLRHFVSTQSEEEDNPSFPRGGRGEAQS